MPTKAISRAGRAGRIGRDLRTDRRPGAGEGSGRTQGRAHRHPGHLHRRSPAAGSPRHAADGRRARRKIGFGLAWAISPAGVFWSMKSTSEGHAGSRTRAADPAELLIDDEDGWPDRSRRGTASAAAHRGCSMPTAERRQLLQFFNLRSHRLRFDGKPLAIAAAGALLGYVEETQKQRLPHLTAIRSKPATARSR
jgi:DNA mismatch repair ATPase MutS